MLEEANQTNQTRPLESLGSRFNYIDHDQEEWARSVWMIGHVSISYNYTAHRALRNKFTIQNDSIHTQKSRKVSAFGEPFWHGKQETFSTTTKKELLNVDQVEYGFWVSVEIEMKFACLGTWFGRIHKHTLWMFLCLECECWWTLGTKLNLTFGSAFAVRMLVGWLVWWRWGGGLNCKRNLLLLTKNLTKPAPKLMMICVRACVLQKRIFIIIIIQTEFN